MDGPGPKNNPSNGDSGSPLPKKFKTQAMKQGVGVWDRDGILLRVQPSWQSTVLHFSTVKQQLSPCVEAGFREESCSASHKAAIRQQKRAYLCSEALEHLLWPLQTTYLFPDLKRRKFSSTEEAVRTTKS
jgi:hypothetical protein